MYGFGFPKGLGCSFQIGGHWPARLRLLLNWASKGTAKMIPAPEDASVLFDLPVAADFKPLTVPLCMHPGGLVPVMDPTTYYACPSVFH